MKNSYGMQSLDQKLTNLLKPLFQGSKKEFIAINNLVKNWSDIVGKKYAPHCYPKSVNFDKTQKTAKLTIAVHNASLGFFLESNSEIILEKIAACYGFKMITKIIIRQEPKNIPNIPTSEIKLSLQEEKFLAEKISVISDENLAQTLQKLGREILRKN